MDPTTVTEWVTRRLPGDATFGARDVATAVAQALVDNKDVQELALADLLEELASDDRYGSYTEGGVSWSKPTLRETADYWRGRVGTKPAGSRFTNVRATFNTGFTATDEWGS